MTTFAKLCKRWRKKRELSMAAAARALKVPYITWQSWEYGKREPRGLSRKLIAAKLAQRKRGHALRTKRVPVRQAHFVA